MWELSTRKLPYEHIKNSWDVASFVLSGGRPPVDGLCPMMFAELMQQCWDKDAAQRPNFNNIMTRLEMLRMLTMNAIEST